ncbi:MAG: ATP-binding cassette domain-containing protein [Treponema sp.]|jgi:ABC-2 type transport system ATP-binding protein|nr:ATP-binding cassette domain-containing protein [Treponema sp.]
MIEVRNLTKKYGPVEAVKDVSFSVGRDQVLGFLGPNGAGKTTIMKILTGFHYPSAGEALVEGVSVQEHPTAVKRSIGYLPESVPLYGDLSVEEYLSFLARMRLVEKSARKAALERAVEACGLGPVRRKRIDTLSKGYRQRTGLGQAIIHDPSILILDEPTTGLDPNQIIEIRSLIKSLGQSKTVILSTHILQEVEAVCSNVLILNGGRIAAQGTPEEIAATMKGGDTWNLCLKGLGAAAIEAKFAAKFARGGAETSALSVTEQDDGTTGLSFFIAGGDDGAGERIFDWAVASGLKILAMSRKKLSLEDIFVQLTTDQNAKEAAS